MLSQRWWPVRIFSTKVVFSLLKPCLDEGADSESSESDGPDIDPDDPMRDYLIAKWKEQKAKKKGELKGKRKHKDETPEERRARKERKKQKKLRKQGGKSAGMRGVEDLLNELEGMSRNRAGRHYSPVADKRRLRSRERRDDPEDYRRRPRDLSDRRSPPPSPRSRGSRYRSRSTSPVRSSYHRNSRHESPGRRPPHDDDVTPPRRRDRD
jgi:RNA-binding motif protein, X-linked 2